jgi:hypothetical protein
MNRPANSRSFRQHALTIGLVAEENGLSQEQLGFDSG